MQNTFKRAGTEVVIGIENKPLDKKAVDEPRIMVLQESRRRTLVKSAGYRVLASATTMGISYAITHKATFAVGIGVADTLSKIPELYLYERFWQRFVTWGRELAPLKDAKR